MPVAGTAADGHYLPGPPGVGGEFWVGDYVRVHTGEGEDDINEADYRVMAITVQRDDDNAELLVVPELRLSQVWTGDAYAGYQHSGFTDLGWAYTDNNPDVGWYYVPEPVGPIRHGEASAPFNSFIIEADMECRLHAAAWWIGVVGDATKTVTIYVNDVAVGSDTESTTGGLHYWNPYLEVDVHNVKLRAGDVVSAHGNDADGGWSNIGVGATFFRVGRGHIVAVGFDWTGP